MPFILEPETPAVDLRGRLSDVRRHLRRGAVVAGGAGVLATLLAVIVVIGMLDRAVNFPGPVRAVLLVGLTLGTVAGVRRWVVSPWRAAGDELGLAMRLQGHFPKLHDSLASAIEFQRDPKSDGSAELKQAAVQYAVQRTRDLDFRGLADRQLTGPLLLALFIAMLVAVPSAIRSPVAVARLFDPYGTHPWPTQTRLEVQAATAIARGEPFDLTATIGGVIPDRAVLAIAVDGAAPLEQTYALSPDESGTASLPLKLEPAKVPRSFRYRLSANDATTGWREVAVRVPPQLVALDGRPTPRIHLDYPSYTDVPPSDLPDGAGACEAILGTALTIRGATDRPIERAFLELRASEPRVIVSLVGLPFATMPGIVNLVAGPAPLHVDEAGTTFAGRVVPPVAGYYDLKFVDAGGLGGRHAIDLRLLPDPSPSVTLERPSVSADSTELVVGATFPLKVIVDDPTFAIRRVAIEYRVLANDPPRRVPLYDGDTLGRALPPLLGVPATAKLRPTRLAFDERIPLAQFKHINGQPLKPGDSLNIAVIAEDFDDVSPDKPAGRSHEIELRIVTGERFDARIQQLRAELAKTLLELHQRQVEALASTTPAERQRRTTGQLRPADLDAMAKAETGQRQLQERLNDESEGGKTQAERLREALANNPGSPKAERARAEHIVAELNRLTEVLDPIGPQLAAARKEPGLVPPNERPSGPLPEAVRRQHDSERLLADLCSTAQANAATSALAAETATLAEDQKRAADERADAAKTIPPGADPTKLDADQRATLGQLQEKQDALAQRGAGLTAAIEQQAKAAAQNAESECAKAEAADAKAATVNEAAKAAALKNQAERHREAEAASRAEAAALEEALKAVLGPDATVEEHMNKAAEALAQNRLGEADRRQDAATEQLNRARDAMRPPTEPDIERLSKQRKNAAEDVARLVGEQEKLQERTLAAEKLTDPEARAKALEELAREQEQMAEQAREMARELNRQGQRDAARELERSARQMDQASNQLDQHRPAADVQDDALDRLDAAAKKAEQDRVEAEESLQREKIVKLVQRVTGLTERQANLSAEGERLFQAAQSAGAWSRSHLKSLADLARDEEGLSKEVEKLTGDQLASLKVLKRIAEQAAAAMQEVSVAVEDAKGGGLTAETLAADRAAIRRPQELAHKRLKQLQAVIQMPKEKPETNTASNGGDAPPPAATDGKPARPQGETDFLPPNAELQALRDLQAELNERTAVLAIEYPDPDKWTDAVRVEVTKLTKAQAELTELFAELFPEPVRPESKK